MLQANFFSNKYKFHPGNFSSLKKSNIPSKKQIKRCMAPKHSKLMMKTGTFIPGQFISLENFLFFIFHSQKYSEQQKYIQDQYQYLQKCKNCLHVTQFKLMEYNYKQNVRRIRFHEKLKMIFLRVLNLWYQYKYSKRYKNTEDPFTLNVPNQPISIYDQKAKGCFVFEARPLMRSMESYLFQNDWLFPQPQNPKNVFTNLPFTNSQLIKIFYEFRKYGAISWAFEAYRKCNWDIDKFYEIYKTALEIEGLKAILRNPSCNEFQTLLREFVEDHYLDYGKNFTTNLDTVYWAIDNEPRHEYIQKWVQLFEKYYTLKFTTGLMGAAGKVQKVEIIVQAKRLLQDYETISKLTIKKRYKRLRRNNEMGSTNSTVSIAESPSPEEDLPLLLPLQANVIIPLGAFVHAATDSEEVDIFIIGDV
jgi:hypothetical protein